MLYLKGRGVCKESEPGEPGFDFISEGWSLPLNVEWNDGMSKIRLWRGGIMAHPGATNL